MSFTSVGRKVVEKDKEAIPVRVTELLFADAAAGIDREGMECAAVELDKYSLGLMCRKISGC